MKKWNVTLCEKCTDEMTFKGREYLGVLHGLHEGRCEHCEPEEEEVEMTDEEAWEEDQERRLDWYMDEKYQAEIAEEDSK